MVGVGNADEIQESGDEHKLCAVVGGSMGNCALAQVLRQADDVQAASSQVSNKAENVENVSTVRFVNVALHQQAKNEHDEDGSEQQEAANPALLDQVTCARDEPSDGRSNDGEHIQGRNDAFASSGICHQMSTISF